MKWINRAVTTPVWLRIASLIASLLLWYFFLEFDLTFGENQNNILFDTIGFLVFCCLYLLLNKTIDPKTFGILDHITFLVMITLLVGQSLVFSYIIFTLISELVVRVLFFLILSNIIIIQIRLLNFSIKIRLLYLGLVNASIYATFELLILINTSQSDVTFGELELVMNFIRITFLLISVIYSVFQINLKKDNDI